MRMLHLLRGVDVVCEGFRCMLPTCQTVLEQLLRLRQNEKYSQLHGIRRIYIFERMGNEPH